MSDKEKDTKEKENKITKTPAPEPADRHELPSPARPYAEEKQADIPDPVENDEEDDMPENEHERLMESKFNHLIALLDDKHYTDFVHELEDMNPVDAADFFNELPEKRIPAVFRMLKKDIAADVFAELDTDVQERIISAMTDREISVMVEDLFLDDAVDMLEEMPANIVHRIMRNVTPDTRAEINRFLAYPEDSAGSVMTAEFIDLRKNMTVQDAIAHIRKTGLDKETVYTAYVTDDARVLEGIVSFKDLLFAKPDEKIADIMTSDIISARTLDDQETVASIISKYDILALPIVDKENRLVGIVTVDDALDVIEDEATEDIEKMAAILPGDKPYMKTGIFETWKKRIPWLLLLMVSATFTSTIISHYEGALSHVSLALSLSAFVPMLMDTGGNAGGQSSVTIIRALSLGEFTQRDIFRIIWKEFRVSVFTGIAVAIACFLKTWVVDCRFSVDPQKLTIAAVVSLTIFFAIVIASIVGACLPMLAKAVKLDPAVMASPFVTTIVDTLTLLVYFAIASRVLNF